MVLKSGFQPLYKQVYEVLKERLVSGYWRAGQVLPSEFSLADELGVSQGTVRKALNQMVAEKLLDRKQGKGTYVSEHTDEGSLFRFFRLREIKAKPDDPVVLPETEVLKTKTRAATKAELSKFKLGASERVAEMLRVRSINGKPAIAEKVVQPLSVFPDIDQITDLPNALYSLYQEKYGVNIVSVRDTVNATLVPKDFAKLLGIEAESPSLMIERESISMDGKTVELSHAFCNSIDFHYQVNIN